MKISTLMAGSLLIMGCHSTQQGLSPPVAFSRYVKTAKYPDKESLFKEVKELTTEIESGKYKEALTIAEKVCRIPENSEFVVKKIDVLNELQKEGGELEEKFRASIRFTVNCHRRRSIKNLRRSPKHRKHRHYKIHISAENIL